MSDKTGIEWTDATWNPVRGCSRVSEGCRNCYAESVAARFSGPGMPYEGLARSTPSGPRWTGKVALIEEHLEDPLRWKKPRRVFVNSMSDLFHPSIPDEWIARIWNVMVRARQHTFQILTKRPERMATVLGPDGIGFYAARGPVRCPQPNIWLGISVENQAAADERIPLLLQTPAAVRFLSCEPLLGPVNLTECAPFVIAGNRGVINALTGCSWHPRTVKFAPPVEHQPGGIDWVIAGGESGPGARPMHPDWARSLRDQCVAARVPFFFKQWGEWAVQSPSLADKRCVIDVEGQRLWTARSWEDNPWAPAGTKHVEPVALLDWVGKKSAGRELDGRTWGEFPEAGSPLGSLAGLGRSRS